jgi:hypothetical protein
MRLSAKHRKTIRRLGPYTSLLVAPQEASLAALNAIVYEPERVAKTREALLRYARSNEDGEFSVLTSLADAYLMAIRYGK